LQAAVTNLKEANPGWDQLASQQLGLMHSLTELRAPRLSMFLDAATILRGQPLEQVMAVWKACHGAGAPTFFTDLDRRSLLRVDKEGRLVMHGMLAALGRGIILRETRGFEEHYGSRVWVEDGRVVGCDQVGFPAMALCGETLMIVRQCPPGHVHVSAPAPAAVLMPPKPWHHWPHGLTSIMLLHCLLSVLVIACTVVDCAPWSCLVMHMHYL
jgi:hypothetical protein